MQCHIFLLVYLEVWDLEQTILKDRIGRDAYDRWQSRWAKYISQQSAGYEFISYLGAQTTVKSTKKEPKKLDKEIKKVQKILKKQKKTDDEIVVKKDMSVNTIEENLGQWLANQILLVEGGAYGHMSHPFDDKGLTFGDFQKI